MIRGEIYWAELRPRSGSEQSGRRPVLIISHDAFNRNQRWQSIIVVPISTSDNQSRRGPTAIALPKGVGGIKQASTLLCHQVTTLDRSKLTDRIGALPGEVLAEVETGLKAALGFAS